MLIEPNAVGLLGHPAVGVRVVGHAARTAGLETLLVVNAAADDDLLATIPEALPLLSRRSFGDQPDQGRTFAEDLRSLNKACDLGPHDCVVVTTGHTEELYGLARFLTNRSGAAPSFHVMLHQLYPPAPDFLDTLDARYRAHAEAELSSALRAVAWTGVRVWTTPSAGLQRAVQRAAGFPVAMAPFPLRPRPQVWQDPGPGLQPMCPHLVFVGDNRYEKGLHLVLRMVLMQGPEWQYTLQATAPRGYAPHSLQTYARLLSEVRERSNVNVVEEALSDSDLDSLLMRCDGALLPYHPGSYDRRASGVLLQALSVGAPPVTTQGTWLAQCCGELQVGVTFVHSGATYGDACALAAGVRALIQNLPEHRRRARQAARAVVERHNPKALIQLLLGETTPCRG